MSTISFLPLCRVMGDRGSAPQNLLATFCHPTGAVAKFQTDPHWRDLILFHEYFHGDNGAGIGASHQTGWTGLVAKLIEQSGE